MPLLCLLSALTLSAILDARTLWTHSQGRPTAPTSDVLNHSPLTPCDTSPQRDRLRIATWNIEAGRSSSIETIAQAISAMRADIVALQEVDYRVRRTGYTDQPEMLASRLKFHYVFAATIWWDEGHYGLAVLSRWPLVSVQRHRLDVVGTAEPRIVLEVVACAGGRPLHLFNHHADLVPAYRRAGLAALLKMVTPHLGKGIVVLGDLNDAPEAAAIRALIDAGLTDVGARENQPTADGGRVDYLLVDGAMQKRLRSAHTWNTDASDHHAVVAEFAW